MGLAYKLKGPGTTGQRNCIGYGNYGREHLDYKGSERLEKG
jgi:hypothetical protein